MTSPGGRPPEREYLLVLVLGAAGAAVVLLALRQAWARVVTHGPAPLPTASVAVSGQDLAPLAGALALAALATLAAVIATRGLGRRLTGGLLAVFGAVIAAAVNVRVSAGAVLAAAHGSLPGSAAAGGAPGVSAAAHVVMVSFPWRAVAVLGALLVVVAGVLVAWRGARWPAMSSRYERPQAAAPRPGTDSAAMWEALSRGVDPTEGEGLAPGAPR